jgi:hypothetical protein
MTAGPQAKAYNDRNVYILGAGFSADAGLPLIKDFMNRMRDAVAWLEEQGDRKGEVSAIERMLDFRLKASAAAYRVPLDVENIEELFSLASASGSAELSDQVTLAIAATLDFCRATARPPDRGRIAVSKIDGGKWGTSQPRNWQLSVQNEQRTDGTPGASVYSCPIYEFYLGLLCGYFNEVEPGRRDTLISLNYDTVVEDALWDLDVPFCYADSQQVEWQSHRPDHFAQPEREPVRLLKLHGSVNLTTRMSEDFGLRVWAYGSYRDLLDAGNMPVLVAPTWQKQLSGYLSAVWRDAVSALRTATRVVILGYSVPQTDQHFRYLLAAGLQDNISLRKVVVVNVDNSAEFKQRLTALLREEHFKPERGLVTILPISVKQSFMDEGYRQLIGRTFKIDAWKLAN